jgi:hypothetical protein
LHDVLAGYILLDCSLSKARVLDERSDMKYQLTIFSISCFWIQARGSVFRLSYASLENLIVQRGLKNVLQVSTATGGKEIIARIASITYGGSAHHYTKWCPAPGCEYGVEFVIESGPYDVTYKCAYNFCCNCCEEAHRPVDFEIVEKWILENNTESENMN